MSDPRRRAAVRCTALHREIAARLRVDPVAVIAQATVNLQRWRAQFGGTLPYGYREWERLLAGDPAALVRLLEANDDKALRLKSSSPFTGILTPRERIDLLQQAV
jgi:hypothetical protein